MKNVNSFYISKRFLSVILLFHFSFLVFSQNSEIKEEDEVNHIIEDFLWNELKVSLKNSDKTKKIEFWILEEDWFIEFFRKEKFKRFGLLKKFPDNYKKLFDNHKIQYYIKQLDIRSQSPILIDGEALKKLGIKKISKPTSKIYEVGSKKIAITIPLFSKDKQYAFFYYDKIDGLEGIMVYKKTTTGKSGWTPYAIHFPGG
ncbi:hypothetical protein [Aquimarina sp. SS2-1]|uniref:hypothetical protein n=1 Tax=Aquimarina besae TaxID=3342247 RepID=UPI00366ABA30